MLVGMTQERALSILKTGANAFVTGEPGAGKTHVINHYTAWLAAAGIPVAITASTGIAATHIGGMTIHSWSGLGTREELTARDLDSIIGKEYLVKRFTRTHVLIIDEISMLDAGVLNMVDRVLKAARDSTEPFGGMQVVFVGDFFQLPPIVKNGDPVRYAFTAASWQDARPLICYLREQHRHEDELLSGLLKAIRTNTVDESHYTLLGEQTDIGYEDLTPTRLFTHNSAVDALNEKELRALPGNKKSSQMKRKGNKMLTDALARSCLSPESLMLCEDAMVMCTKNNFEAGYANGTLGRIIGFESDTKLPIIQTAEGVEITIKPATWSIMDQGKPIAEITQLPLRLAWAITVHKSQGMSLDAVEMDLANAFVYGQGYVALSRVRTLRGLKVLGLNPNALQVDPAIVAEDEGFGALAEEADSQFAEMSEDALNDLHHAFVRTRGKQMPKATEPGELPVAPPKKSTHTLTLEALTATKSIDGAAAARGITDGTIIAHLETLYDEGEIDATLLHELLPAEPAWESVETELFAIMDKEGIEKLKPIHEAAEGKYDYLFLRVARLMYRTARGG